MSDVDYLYETEDTGQLRVDPKSGKAFRDHQVPVSQPGASLSGPMPDFGRGVWEVSGNRGAGSPMDRNRSYAGLGGSTPSPVVADAIANQRTRRYTADELMALADKMEQDMLVAAIKDRGPAVKPDTGLTPPQWLAQFMSSQPNAGEIQYGPQLTESGYRRNKYTSDADDEKMKRFQALKPFSRK